MLNRLELSFHSILWIGILVIPVTSVASAETPAEFAQLRLHVAVSQRHERSETRPDLLVHFHGAPTAVEPQFHGAGMTGALVVINCNGLSSAYRVPFENEELFPYVLRRAKQQLISAGTLDDTADWGRIDLSCFSAGYGAVRELLQDDSLLKRISSLTAADSIYASIHLDGTQRLVDQQQMEPFLKFARLAVREEKLFVLSHSQLPVEPYASTVETAEYLLQRTQVTRVAVSQADSGGLQPTTRAAKGGFVVLGYPGGDGDAHLSHLRHIGSLWAKVQQHRDRGKRP